MFYVLKIHLIGFGEVRGYRIINKPSQRSCYFINVKQA